MSVVRKVFIAVDGSKNGENAFKEYICQYKRKNDQVTLIHVYRPPPITALPIDSEASILKSDNYLKALNDILNKSKEILKSYAEICEENSLECSVLLNSIGGKGIGETILRSVEKVKPDLIIMGSRGLGPVSRLFLGSVSDYLVHRARFPVLVIPFHK